MKPGTNRIVWGLCSLALCGMTIAVASRFPGSAPLYGFGGNMAFWLFLAASAIIGSIGAFLLLIGARERNQFRRATASISGAPDHVPASPLELITRIVVTLAASDGDLTDQKANALRGILAQARRQPVDPAAVAALFPGAVSSDIASEVLAARHWIDAGARDFILHACYLLVEAMDDPGPVQEALLIRVAAAMDMSELDLKEHFDRLADEAVPLPQLGAADRKT